jgi:hypothetical protein
MSHSPLQGAFKIAQPASLGAGVCYELPLSIMNVNKYILTAIAVPILVLITFTITRWYRDTCTDIPMKTLLFDGRNIKDGQIVRWVEGVTVKNGKAIPGKSGVATIFCPKFTIALEDADFLEMSAVRGQYQVDGRVGGIPWQEDKGEWEDLGGGARYGYFYTRREAHITYKSHRFIYCDYLNTLKADGKEYSTANGPLHLWVTKAGKIKLRNSSEAPPPQIG